MSDRVPKLLGLKANQVRTLHGGMADVKQMDVIEEFGQREAPVRLLFTGDMASEGVNLHQQCHHLIHFDLPWSLITIEQRNGRIDRYGQEHRPDIRALLLTPDHPSLGDIRIFTRLLQREHEAHKAFGESGSLLGLHDAALEEEAIMRSLEERADPDHVIPAEPQQPFDILTLLAGATGHDPVPLTSTPSLFASDRAFVDEALRAAFGDADRELDIRRETTDPELLSFVPPRDLARRLGALPQSYLSEQRIVERLRVTGDAVVAEHALRRARETKDSMWPEIGHLSPLHPFLDWLTDKVLVAVGRNQAPVLIAEVDEPVVCVQGLYANGQGRPQLVEWLAVTPSSGRGRPQVEDLFAVLDRAGIRDGMANPGVPIDLAPLRKALPAVLAAARDELAGRRQAHDERLDELLAEPSARLQHWVQQAQALAFDLPEPQRVRRERDTRTVREETLKTIEALRTTGEPLVRVLAVIARRPR
ncbi:MAG: C-terminal helicase domain-containing protein [Acidimicrobiales bacterium]